MATALVSAAFIGAALIRLEALIRGRYLFQCGYPKARRLFEDRRLLERIRYVIKSHEATMAFQRGMTFPQ